VKQLSTLLLYLDLHFDACHPCTCLHVIPVDVTLAPETLLGKGRGI
jgi:hypothetical protein